MLRLIGRQANMLALWVKLGDVTVTGDVDTSMRIRPGSVEEPALIGVGANETHISIFCEGNPGDVITELGGWNWAVKAQIHAGARGKAGGIKLCKTYHEVRDAAAGLLGKRLVTIQTGPEGKPVQRVYIEVAEPFDRELYLGYVLDRKAERIRVIASQRGGM
jgi:succinyl-CoA synthetase beta subunit